VDCTGAVPRLVREGALKTAVLRAVVPALLGDR
jgi:tRNA A37 threonylcarbamoyladenosine synthetase subunit TsaC/SUA5/YrdC